MGRIRITERVARGLDLLLEVGRQTVCVENQDESAMFPPGTDEGNDVEAAMEWMQSNTLAARVRRQRRDPR